MYKILIILTSFVLVLSAADYTSAAVDASIPETLVPPVIDGIREDVWLVCEEHKIVDIYAGYPPDSNSDLSGSWWALWDANNFYVFVDVNDSDLQDDDPLEQESWNDDSVEIYIDIGNDQLGESFGEDDYQYRVEWGTAELEEYLHGRYWGIELSVYTKNVGSGDGGRGDGYTIEIMFPWETLDYLDRGLTTLGDLMGLDVAINDDDGGGGRDTQLFWPEPPNVLAWVEFFWGTVELDGCFPAWHPDYYEWVSVGKPECWCDSRQCHGNADGKQQAIGKCLYWVTNNDLLILLDGYVRDYSGDPNIDTWICADFDHKAQQVGKPYYRVTNDDLLILVEYYVGGGSDCNDCITGEPLHEGAYSGETSSAEAVSCDSCL